mmetsp:Transcript_9143/g.22718  ORF Transcript_9143/g.22718 Transcript_9143/m.22718 type:complete len:677 (+) Transcript_9143:152-2182(+)
MWAPAAVDTPAAVTFVGSSDYVWSLMPYALPLWAGFLLILLMPCCAVAVERLRSRRRSSSANVGIYATFALLGLGTAIATVLVFQGLRHSDNAYQRARCASYSALDLALTGRRDDQFDFLGLHNLTDAIQSAAILFPQMRRNIYVAKDQIDKAINKTGLVKQAHDLKDSWMATHRVQMEATSYRSILSQKQYFVPLDSCMAKFRQAQTALRTMLNVSLDVLDGPAPTVSSGVGNTLQRINNMYQVIQGWSGDFRGSYDRMDGLWAVHCGMMYWVMAGVMMIVALGILQLTECHTPTLAAIVAAGAHCHIAFCLVTCTVLLSAAVLSHDSCDFLEANLLTTAGLQTYDNVFTRFDASQRDAVVACVFPQQTGNLRDIFNITFNTDQLREAVATQRLTAKPALLSDNTSRAMGSFLDRLQNTDGTNYVAMWDASQTLDWNSTYGGVNELTVKLWNLTNERWAFEKAASPPNCPMALKFNPQSTVAESNCWVVDPETPSSSDIQERYRMLDGTQMQRVLELFRDARVTSQALAAAAQFLPVGKFYVKSTRKAFDETRSGLKDALGDVGTEVTAPMAAVAESLDSVMNRSNCRDIFRTYQQFKTATCHDLIGASLTNVGLVLAVAVLSWMISLLFACIYANTGGARKVADVSADLESEESLLSGSSDSESSGGDESSEDS